MTLTVGTQLGSHEITALLGKGGMGEVYRARDLKLKREVAIKILPEELARDADRVSRFQREAEVLASLNHPNIAAIHDLEETGGTRYLVLELVEGETLGDRIARGPIPVEEALDIAIQICEALEAAHERGVIHRDLKPANVKLTPEGKVKVLDFGLAKAYERESPDVSRSNSPTLSMAATNAGVILGTAAYMSPEQAVGRHVDRRADIWSFGVVLWEMLTGKILFTGDTMAHILANVINREIDFGNLPDRTPARIRELLKRCLDRDVKTRLQVIGEARIALQRYLANPGLESVSVPATQTVAKSGTLASKLPWIIATAVFALATVSALWTLWRAAPPGNQSLVRLNLDLPGYFGEVNGAGFALSPDGSRIVYMQRQDSGRSVLVTRSLAESEFTVLRGTEGAQGPFFSPDGQWIGFVADGRLQKVSVRGGAPVTLTTSSGIGGAAWGKDGSIVASLNYGAPLSRIPDTPGGTPQEVVGRSEASNVMSFPQYLPGGNSVLYALGFGNAPGIYAKNFSTGKVQRLIENSQFARYLPTGSKGHLVYVDQGTLFASPFDPGKLELLGPPQPVLSDIAQDSDGANTAIAFSDTGESLYRIGHAGAQTWPVQWMDGEGKTSVLLASPRSYIHPRFSPDREGRFLALVDENRTNGTRVIVYDWKNDISVNLDKQGESRWFPVWSPDGHHLAMSNPKGIVWMRSDGAGEPHQILESKNGLLPASISPDGRFIAYSENDSKTMWDIWVAPLDLQNPDQPVVGKPELVLRTPGNDFFPVFSPDGKWLAYFSDEFGETQVYVRPFPGPGTAQPVSNGNGAYPTWASNGHELWFEKLGTVEVVDYRVNGNAFLASPPRVWNKAPYRLLGANLAWALHPDGKRIAMFPPEQADNKQAAPRFGFLLNFFDEVKRLAPVK